MTEEAFQKACSTVEKNGAKINQPTLLKLYSYYKQATEGDASGKRPGLMKLRDRAKHDGWKALEGMSSEEASKTDSPENKDEDSNSQNK